MPAGMGEGAKKFWEISKFFKKRLTLLVAIMQNVLIVLIHCC
jgi:hypothetical protein